MEETWIITNCFDTPAHHHHLKTSSSPSKWMLQLVLLLLQLSCWLLGEFSFPQQIIHNLISSDILKVPALLWILAKFLLYHVWLAHYLLMDWFACASLQFDLSNQTIYVLKVVVCIKQVFSWLFMSRWTKRAAEWSEILPLSKMWRKKGREGQEDGERGLGLEEGERKGTGGGQKGEREMERERDD